MRRKHATYGQAVTQRIHGTDCSGHIVKLGPLGRKALVNFGGWLSWCPLSELELLNSWSAED